MNMHVQIITPEKVLIDEEASQIIVPTTTGELTILPHHTELVSEIAPGELRIKRNDREESMVVIGGFLEVSKKSVTILADYAVAGKDISAVKAQEAKERAEKAMKEKTTAENFATLQAEFQKAILELKVAGKYRKVT